jgi:hypothetical protein
METKIRELKKNGQYSEALAFFKTEYARKQNAGDIAQKPYLVADLLFCLRKTDQSAAALKFYFRFLGLGISENVQLKHEVVWNLLATIKLNQYELFRKEALQIVATLEPQRDKWAFSLFFFKLIQTEMAQKNADYPALLSLLGGIKPEKLNSLPQEIEIKGKKKQLNSEVEKYYLLYSKLLYQQKQYEPCIALLSQIPESIRPANSFWLKRTLALSMAHKGEKQKATEMLLEQMQAPTAWFIYLDLYHINTESENQGDLFLMLSMLLPGVLDFKVKALEILSINPAFASEIRVQAQDLAHQIRVRNKWIKSDKNADAPKEIMQNYIALLNNLLQLMQQKKWLHFGKIGRVLHKGIHGDGFCGTPDKKWYFKRRNVLNTDKYKDLDEGVPVFFVAGTSVYNGEKREIAQWLWIAENNKINWPPNSYSLNKI